MFKRILFPVDIGDPHSWTGSMPIVLDCQKAFGAELCIMTVIPDYGLSMVQKYFPKGWLQETINNAKKQLQTIVKSYAAPGTVISTLVERGAVYQAIIDTAVRTRTDLIMMSANRPELKDYLLGPNAAKVVRHSKISVLIVRDPEDLDVAVPEPTA